jgi:hypothetical protein
MSAGYMQLAAIGQQDAYLTGSPQITYFSGVYKRHTPFVLEAFDIPFKDQQVLYGQTNIAKIPVKGDIIRGITAKITLPGLNDPGVNWIWPTPTGVSYMPYIIINGTYYTTTANSSIQYLSTSTFNSWISSTPYIYNPQAPVVSLSNIISISSNLLTTWTVISNTSSANSFIGNVMFSNSSFVQGLSNIITFSNSQALNSNVSNVAIGFFGNVSTQIGTGNTYFINVVSWANTVLPLSKQNILSNTGGVAFYGNTVISSLANLIFGGDIRVQTPKTITANANIYLSGSATSISNVAASYSIGSLNVSYGTSTSNNFPTTGIPVGSIVTFGSFTNVYQVNVTSWANTIMPVIGQFVNVSIGTSNYLGNTVVSTTTNINFSNQLTKDVAANTQVTYGGIQIANVASAYTAGSTSSVQYNSSNNFPNQGISLGQYIFLGPSSSNYPPLSSLVSYDSVNNSFVFSGAKTIEVDSKFVVFWGFDPTQSSSINGSNLVYTSSTSVSPGLSLQLSGWNNIPSFVNPRSGIVWNPSSTNTVGPSATYVNMLNWSPQIILTNPPYMITLSEPIIGLPSQNTPGGRIKFSSSGWYIVRICFNLTAGSIKNISIGSTNTEKTTDYYSGNFNPTFEEVYDFTVSPDPSSPLTFPIYVSSTSNTYYLYGTSSFTSTINQNISYISVNSVDEVYKPLQNIQMNNRNILLYSNVVTPLVNSSCLLASDSSFSFTSPGIFLLTGVIYMSGQTSSQYVSNVSIRSSDSVVSSVDLSQQGRDPTYVFSIPLNASTGINYTINIDLNSAGVWYVKQSSFFSISQIGVGNGAGSGAFLPYGGILLQAPSPTTQTGQGNLGLSGWTSTGGDYMALSGDSVAITKPAIYMLTASINSTDPISSITFGQNTYNVGVSLSPPYPVSIPVYLTAGNYPVSIQCTTSGTQNLSNSFVAIYPISSNIYVPNNIYPYNDSVGTWIINTAELKIGGQSIQTLTGEYIELWNDLHIPYENQSGLTILTGKYDTSSVLKARTYYVSLPFYFYGSEELGLPISAIDRQDVEVWLTYKNFSDLTSTALTNPSLQSSLIIEYAYLSEPEINWMKTHTLDYLITQQQYQFIPLLPNFTSSIFKLNLLNPVREIIFVIQPDDNNNYDYSNNGLTSLGMTFNTSEVFNTDVVDAKYLGTLVPYNCYAKCPTRNFYIYTFATNNDTSRPYGAVNMSRIKDILLKINTSAYQGSKSLRVCAINYNILRIENGVAGIMFNSGTVSVPRK